MVIRAYVHQKLAEIDDFSTLVEDKEFEEVARILANSVPYLETKLKKLLSLGRPPMILRDKFRKYYFQEKGVFDGFELLHFSHFDDREIYVIGFPEKALPFIKPTLDKGEVLRVSSNWVRQGFKPYLVGFLDSAKKLGSLHPSHLRDKLYFSGLIGVDT